MGRRSIPKPFILTDSATEHFRDHVSTDHDHWYMNSKCWDWAGKYNKTGYGLLYVRHCGYIFSHRYSVLLSGRKIPEGMVVDHLCERSECVNPDHLEIVTTAENNRRVHVRRELRRDYKEFAPANLVVGNRMYYARLESEERGDEYIDSYLVSIIEQVKYHKQWKNLPIRAKRCFERWKQDMKILTVLSDQLVTDIETQRRKYLAKGVPLSRLGMIRILLMEALALRDVSGENEQRGLDMLVVDYRKKLRTRGAYGDDPAAPPDGRKPRKLPDGTTLDDDHDDDDGDPTRPNP